MARTFDGTNDEIRVAIGACNITADVTMAAIFRRTTSDYHGIMAIHDSGGSVTYAMEVSDANFIEFTGNINFGATTITTTDGWACLAFTKTTGTVAARGHKYVFSTNTWTHVTASTNNANVGSAAGGTVRFGEWQDADDFTGDLAVAGLWNRALTDDECERLVISLNQWYAASPSGLWIFDQSLTTQNVSDLTGGGANQSGTGGSLVGTTVSTVSVPLFSIGDPIWTYIYPKVVVGGAQDTPELYGRPGGLRGENQMRQLLAV